MESDRHEVRPRVGAGVPQGCYHRRRDTNWDCLLLDCRLASLVDNGRPYGRIDDAAIAWKDGHITFCLLYTSRCV